MVEGLEGYSYEDQLGFEDQYSGDKILAGWPDWGLQDIERVWEFGSGWLEMVLGGGGTV